MDVSARLEWGEDMMLGHTVPAHTPSSTHPMITLRDPNGVTRMGGAKAYAAKFTTRGRARDGQPNPTIRAKITTHIPPTPLIQRHAVPTTIPDRLNFSSPE